MLLPPRTDKRVLPAEISALCRLISVTEGVTAAYIGINEIALGCFADWVKSAVPRVFRHGALPARYINVIVCRKQYGKYALCCLTENVSDQKLTKKIPIYILFTN